MLLSVEARSGDCRVEDGAGDCLRSLRRVDLSGRREAEGIVGRASASSMAPLTIPAVDDSPNRCSSSTR